MPPVEICLTQTVLSLDSNGRDRAALWLPELVEIGATGKRVRRRGRIGILEGGPEEAHQAYLADFGG